MNDIRFATPDDLAQIKSLLINTWHYTFDDIYGVDAVNQLCSVWGDEANLISRILMDNARCLVATCDGNIVGMAFANGPNTENIAYLSQLYVSEKSQGFGIGKALLIDIENTYVNAHIMRLGVDALNENAIAFYEHMGYQNTGIMFERETGWHKFQSLIFEKHLGSSGSSGH